MWDDQTPSSGTVVAVVRAVMLSLVVEQSSSDYHLLQKLPATTTCRQAAVTGCLRSPATDLFDAGVQKLVPRYDTCFNSCDTYVER
ncbi:hypothetical protein AVEN_129845-1 [Araneus ventricosus]|uniref:Uncharacterized protein n=1 Tax=Araneus ventricosus TaxID=182803 RepID=A0A4Y2VW57_ARAVE|nr:hypothetical protein AVEN_129845-1 [Araneus ventricosus]